MPNYRMPAEWEKQEAIWLPWPHEKRDWPGKFAPIPWVFVEFARLISAHQKVRLVVKDERARDQAAAMLEQGSANMANVEFFTLPFNRGWMRDCGPIFVYDEKKRKTLLDWGFNGWAKYPNHKLDNRVPEHINERLRLPRVKPTHKGRPVVLEGGGIDVNGKGSILTSEEWLLSDVQVRNPGFTRADYEEIFATWLGAPNTIWLGEGIIGDDTHGHIDDLARFVNPTTVVTAVERNKKDENHPRLQDNLKRLKRARDQDGKPLDVVELPMPRPIHFDGERLPPSYANFLVTNRLVLVPTFNDPADREVLNTLATLFPTREVVGVHCVDLILGLGTLHCTSQQEIA